MDIVSGIVVYILLWWWVLFMVLPFGAKAPETVETGHAPSAPQRPMLVKKMLITTVIAAVLWVGTDAIIASGIFTFRGSISEG